MFIAELFTQLYLRFFFYHSDSDSPRVGVYPFNITFYLLCRERL